MTVPGYFKLDFEDVGASTSRSTLSNNALMDGTMAHPFAFSAPPISCVYPCSTVQVQGHRSTCSDSVIAEDPYLHFCSTSAQSYPKPTPNSFTLPPPNFDCFENELSTSTMSGSSHNYMSLNNVISSETASSALDSFPSTSHGNPNVREGDDSTKKFGKPKSEGLVAKRNARERRRVQAVNGAFSKLRKHIPYENRNKRLSKVKTLRIAIEYIHNLEDLLHGFDVDKFCHKRLIAAGGVNQTM